MSEAPAIGIDLGTTYSCVSVFQHGEVKIIPNDQGNRTTPSFVSFTNGEILIGEAAEDQIETNPLSTIFDTKRLIGRGYYDKTVQTDRRYWPFVVVNDKDKVKIRALYKGKIERFFPEEISSMVLKKMKQTAEAYLGKTVTDAVVTVPASFSISQRQATKDAAVIAGLNVLRLMNESTAVAIAHSLYRQDTGKKSALIIDLGGSTFDASVVTIMNGNFEVIKTLGDSHLGGEDFNDRMVDYFVKTIRMNYRKDLRIRTVENIKVLNRLRIACEKAKRTLSSSTEARIEIDSLFEGIDFYVDITREQFEQLCEDLFTRILNIATLAVKDVYHLDQFVLVGGSSRIPKIQKLLQDHICCNYTEINQSINPDEAVAYGAAVQAAILRGNKSEVLQRLSLVDILNLPLGIEGARGVMIPVIEKYKRIPIKETKTYTTYSDNQPDVLIHVCDGDRAMTIDNNSVGKFELTGIPLAPRGVPQIQITFDIDASGILTISAIEKSTGKEHKITVRNQERSEEGINSMVEKMKMYCKVDQDQQDCCRELLDVPLFEHEEYNTGG